jgi:hypothetical protein
VPLKGPQLAYYMKRRNPELYRKAKELKERYGVTWDYAFAILRGEREPPPQAIATGGEIQVSDVVKRVEALEKRVGELGKHYTNLLANSIRLSAIVNMLSMGLDRRFNFEEYRCTYMDGEGYCKLFYWAAPLKDYETKEVVESGEKRYYMNVKVHRWVCALCPKYTPKHLAETLSNLRTRLDLLESEIAQLKQSVTVQSTTSGEKLRETLERLRRELKL